MKIIGGDSILSCLVLEDAFHVTAWHHIVLTKGVAMTTDHDDGSCCEGPCCSPSPLLSYRPVGSGRLKQA